LITTTILVAIELSTTNIFSSKKEEDKVELSDLEKLSAITVLDVKKT
jgi:hypothetical protein